MKILDKVTAYRKLNEIKQSHKENIKPYIESMVRSDVIPHNVIVFINKFQPLEQLETYNRIYERRRSNPLYKNLVNENLSNDDKSIALSSLLTQSLIRMKSINEEKDRQEYADIMNISMITEAICDYSIYGNTDKLNKTFMSVREVFKNLFSK